jgi:hypothetical protein
LGTVVCAAFALVAEGQSEGLFFPKGTNLASIISISDSALGSSEQQLMIGTLQGLVARLSSQQIFIDSSTYSRWRQHLTSVFRIPYSTQADPWALVTQFRSLVSGYVLYDYANTNSRNAATSLCGPLNGIAVDLTLEAAVRARGVTNRLADVRAQNESTVHANYPGLFNPRLAVEQDESFRTQLRDYAVMAKAFTFADGTTPFRALVLAGLEPDAALLGWGQGSENSFIGPASDAGVFTVPADHARNVSILSSVRAPPVRQQTHQLPTTETNVHYVAFLVTDGDNLQWTLGDFPDYFNHPARGSFSMGWALPPSLVDLAPSALHWFFASASNGVARDFFVAGPSGLGYMYPSRYPLRELERHTRRLHDFAAWNDLRIAQIIDFNSFTRFDLWSRYTAQPNLDAIIYIEYSRYDARAGALQWQNGKPILSPRKMLWSGLSGADEPSVTSALNSAARDPYSAGGYSLVMVHVWSKDLGNVQTVVNALSPQVRVVTPGELVQLMITNIAGKHSFDFENGRQGWVSSTGGEPGDVADWGNGTLRLGGSDTAADTTANAVFTRPVSLPINATQLRFDTRADGGGLLRVRLRRANGTFVLLSDWSGLPDQNWHTASVSLEPYAGEDVTVYLEQNAGVSGADQTRYVDNLVIERNGVANVVEAEADVYVRDGDLVPIDSGSALVLSVGGGAERDESYLRFALTNISGRVLDAKLRLTPRTVSGAATNALAIALESPWGEQTMTWDNRPPSSAPTTNWQPTQSVPVDLNVSAAIQEALTRGIPISFRVYAPDAAPAVSYASREEHALYSPKLIVLTSNTPPSISSIPAQTLARSGSVTLPLTIGDAESPPNLLRLTGASSNPTLVPTTNISFAGSGSTRFVAITAAPGQLGSSVIILTVTDGVLSTATQFTVTVEGQNNPPTSVQITAPAPGARFNAPAAVPFTATATDPDGNVTRVDYFLGSAVIGSAIGTPFSFSWTNVPPGTYNVSAVATDTGGLSVTSAVRQVIVENAQVTLIPAGAVWRFFDVNGVDLGTAWRGTNYNDVAWRSGPAKLGFGDPATTLVDDDPTRVTTYFRHRFVVTNAPAVTALTFGLMRDDGGVVHLNGNEVYRSGMPNGTISYLTIASSAISGSEETTWFTNRVTGRSGLVNGTNVLAVEVHQGSASSSDLGFNFLLVGHYAAEPVPPASMQIQPAVGGLVLSWPFHSGWNLYASPTLGPGSVWTRVTDFQTANGQSSISISVTQAARFFQLRQP